VGLDDPQILEREARRQLPHFLQRLAVGRLARLDDQVAHAELLDERHHFLLRAGADREHGDHGRHAEDHAQHREQRPQLVRAQVLEPEAELGQDVRGPEMRTRVEHYLAEAVPPGIGPDAEDFERWAAMSGSMSAMTSPSLRPETTARLSVRFTTLTSRRSK